MVKVSDIIDAIEAVAPAGLQESWDNTGLQVGRRDAEVGSVLCVLDVTPARIDEAIEFGCDMVVSHHPLIFNGLKSITDDNEVQRAVAKALQAGIAVYSSHTAVDNAVGGVSALMANRLGAKVLRPLVPGAPGAETGTGVVAELPEPMTGEVLIERAKAAFGCDAVRASDPRRAPGSDAIRRIALCGGAGGSFIDDAVRADAQAYITGDIRYHDFVDNGGRILLIDCGHFETEADSRALFADLITTRFPDVKAIVSPTETNSVKYY